MKRILIFTLLFLSTLFSNSSYAQAIIPSYECTTGLIVSNGVVITSTTWCVWVYTPSFENVEIGEDDNIGGMPSGSTEVSQECYNHRQTINQLPASCRFLDTGKPPNLNWNQHFHDDTWRNMTCSATSCSVPATSRGPFETGNSDAFSLQLLSALGSNYWYSYDATSMLQSIQPILQQRCQQLPEDSFFNYDQGDCFQDARDFMNELAPHQGNTIFNWLNGISVHGISFSSPASNPSFGFTFLQRIADFRICADWHEQRRQLCPN